MIKLLNVDHPSYKNLTKARLVSSTKNPNPDSEFKSLKSLTFSNYSSSDFIGKQNGKIRFYLASMQIVLDSYLKNLIFLLSNDRQHKEEKTFSIFNPNSRKILLRPKRPVSKYKTFRINKAFISKTINKIFKFKEKYYALCSTAGSYCVIFDFAERSQSAIYRIEKEELFLNATLMNQNTIAILLSDRKIKIALLSSVKSRIKIIQVHFEKFEEDQGNEKKELTEPKLLSVVPVSMEFENQIGDIAFLKSKTNPGFLLIGRKKKYINFLKLNSLYQKKLMKKIKINLEDNNEVKRFLCIFKERVVLSLNGSDNLIIFTIESDTLEKGGDCNLM